MPGPISNGVRQDPTATSLTAANIKPNGKTAVRAANGKTGPRYASKNKCAIRNGGGKFRGEHSCPDHPGKR